MTEAYKKRKAEYIKRYQKEIYTSISFKLRTKDDSELVEHLRKVTPNASEYIKRLIKEDIERTKAVGIGEKPQQKQQILNN